MIMMNMLTQSFADFFDWVPLDWRWRYCQLRAKQRGAQSIKSNDADLEAGVRFLTALRRCRTTAAVDQLARRHWHLAAAHTINTTEPPFARWLLEARLLTGEPLTEVAAKLRLQEETVRVYEQFFFAVRDRLHAHSFILTQAIGQPDQRSLTEEDIGILVKFVAFVGGPDVLDSALDYYIQPPVLPASLDGLDGESARRLWARLWIRLVITVVLRNGRAPNASLMKAVTQIHELFATVTQQPYGDPVTNLRALLIMLDRFQAAQDTDHQSQQPGPIQQAFRSYLIQHRGTIHVELPRASSQAPKRKSDRIQRHRGVDRVPLMIA